MHIAPHSHNRSSNARLPEKSQRDRKDRRHELHIEELRSAVTDGIDFAVVM